MSAKHVASQDSPLSLAALSVRLCLAVKWDPMPSRNCWLVGILYMYGKNLSLDDFSNSPFNIKLGFM